MTQIDAALLEADPASEAAGVVQRQGSLTLLDQLARARNLSAKAVALTSRTVDGQIGRAQQQIASPVNSEA